jgi:hypothetical protein
MIRYLFRSRSKGGFKSRASERDINADNEAVNSIARAIDLVLEKAESEQAGLKRRINEVISRAAIAGGNDIDDYLTRTEDRSSMLKDSDNEIRRGQERLGIIEQNISHFKFLKTALQTRFPKVPLHNSEKTDERTSDTSDQGSNFSDRDVAS